MTKNTPYTLTPEERKVRIDKVNYSKNEINLSMKNRKLGPAIISLPMPVSVCDPNLPCAKECYAKHGCQSFCQVVGAYERNLRLWNENHEKFFEELWHKIKASGLNHVRFFDAGDYPSYEFFIHTIRLARKCPDINFMAYTKKYAYVNQFLDEGGVLPDNYNIFFSAWDKTWEVPNPHNLPQAYVDFEDESRTPEIPSGCFKCAGRATTCSACKACWNKNIKGVVFAQH